MGDCGSVPPPGDAPPSDAGLPPPLTEGLHPAAKILSSSETNLLHLAAEQIQQQGWAVTQEESKTIFREDDHEERHSR